MGDATKTSPCVPSTSVHNAILSLLFIHIIPSRRIYLAIDNPSLLRSVYCLTVLLVVAICGSTCMQPSMLPTLKTCKPMAASAFLTCTNLEIGSKLPELSGIAVSARAN